MSTINSSKTIVVTRGYELDLNFCDTDKGIKYPAGLLFMYAVLLSILKSVRLPAEAMPPANAPVQSPDCHIRKQPSPDPGQPVRISV